MHTLNRLLKRVGDAHSMMHTHCGMLAAATAVPSNSTRFGLLPQEHGPPTRLSGCQDCACLDEALACRLNGILNLKMKCGVPLRHCKNSKGCSPRKGKRHSVPGARKTIIFPGPAFHSAMGCVHQHFPPGSFSLVLTENATRKWWKRWSFRVILRPWAYLKMRAYQIILFVAHLLGNLEFCWERSITFT